MTGRGVIGREVRVKGARGVYKISGVHADGLFDVCRLRPGRGGRCVEDFMLSREQIKFVRRNYAR